MEKPTSTSVRPEYSKAGEKLLALFSLLGKERTDEIDRRTRLFFIAVEAVDRCHDELKTPEEREALRREIAAFIKGEAANIPAELVQPLQELSTLVDDTGRTEEFSRSVEAIFSKGELLRIQKDVYEAITLCLEEGAHTAELLMITLNTRDPALEAFMREIGALGKLCDDIIDLEDDLKNKQRVYAEPYLFYGVALPNAIFKGLKILWGHPGFAKPAILIQFLPSILRLIKRKFLSRVGKGTQSLPLSPEGSQP